MMNNIRTVVGAVVYDNRGRVLLGKSPKWNDKYVILGGAVQDGEDSLDALSREIWEESEQTVRIIRAYYAGKKVAPPEEHELGLELHMIDYFAEGEQVGDRLDHNEEFSEIGWYTLEEALSLDLAKPTKQLVAEFRVWKRKTRNLE